MRAVLVWRAAGPDVRTWWVEGQGADIEIVAERTGLWAFARDDIFGWHTTKRRIKVCDPVACAEQDGACVPTMVHNGPFAGRIDDVEFVGLISGQRHPLGARLPDSVAVGLGTPGFRRVWEPVVQTADGLVVDVRTETMACGAMQGEDHLERQRVLLPDGLLSADQPHSNAEGALSPAGSNDKPDFGAGAPDIVAIAKLLPSLPVDAPSEIVHFGWSEVHSAGTRRELLQQRFLCSKAAP